MRLLYVGPTYLGSNGTCWRDAFRELGHEVAEIDDEAAVRPPRGPVARLARRWRVTPSGTDIDALNERIGKEVARLRPGFVFYVKAPYVLPETLERVGGYCPNVVYMNDDMFNPRNQGFTFRANVCRFDWIFTTKSFNVREFHALGAPRALYLPNAYDPKIHFPAAGQPQPVEDIAFIGTFRPERADFLARIARLRPEFTLHVWGGGWTKMRRFDFWHKRRSWSGLWSCVQGAELWAAELGRAIGGHKICLGLLNHDNRDLHTSRSFEIPACGGFMLAERTEEHRLYFQEDQEAVYFESFEELVSKLRFYIAHEELRQRIARAGYERCVKSGYRYVDRARVVIDCLTNRAAPTADLTQAGWSR